MKILIMLISLFFLSGCLKNTLKSDMYTTNPAPSTTTIIQNPTVTPVITTTESDEELLLQLDQNSSEPDLSSQFSQLEVELK